VRLSHATAWNLVGLGFPLVLAAITIPLLIDNLGQERFGLLALMWALLGTASLFDFGLGRALTVAVARKFAESDSEGAIISIRAGLFSLACIGFIFASIAASCSGFMVAVIDREIVGSNELELAIRIAAPAILLVVVNSGVNGCLEAFRRFEYLNVVRIVVALGTIGGSTLWSFRSNSLPELATVLVFARFFSLTLGSLLLRSGTSSFRCQRKLIFLDIWKFLAFSRWMTAANLLNPILAFGDRLMLSVLVPASSLAYYLVPYDIVTKVLILPSAVASSLLPPLSGSSDPNEHARLMKLGVKPLCWITLPALFLGISSAGPALAWWISDDFAVFGAPIAQVLCLGVGFNSIGVLAYVYLLSQRMAKYLVFAQLAEVPLYLVTLVVAGKFFGGIGVASAWASRMMLDALLLWLIVRNVHKRKISERQVRTDSGESG